MCPMGRLDSLMASPFGRKMSNEQEQTSNSSARQLRTTARAFRNSDLESVRAVNEPEPTPRNQASSQRNVARSFANWRKIDSRLSRKPQSLSGLRLDSQLLSRFRLSLGRASDAKNPEESKRKSHFHSERSNRGRGY